MDLTPELREEMKSRLLEWYDEALIESALVKPKRKNIKRAPFNKAVLEHLRVNDDITVDDMKPMPAYTDARPTRNAALKNAEKSLNIKLDKDGLHRWYKVKDNTEAYDAIFAEMKVDLTYQESKMREWCEKHKTDFDATVEAMKERRVRVGLHHITKTLTFKVIP